MLANEALEVLALRPGASPVEIKAAYRDLVKVWHPDRFGDDARLRHKAEDKLKQLNDAYRVLQADPGAGGGYAAGAERLLVRLLGVGQQFVAPPRRLHRTVVPGRTAKQWVLGGFMAAWGCRWHFW